MGRIVINLLKPNWQALQREMKRFFFDSPKSKSIFLAEQIEVLWRWFSVQQEQINFIDIASCGNLDECVELFNKYFGDERLFFDKIFYR